MQHRPDRFSPPEFPILTEDGVRSTDVVWITIERRRQTIADSAASIAPEICVEVMSPGNTMAQMQKKGRLYLQAGALEYWICDESQKLHFFSQTEELSKSDIIPSLIEVRPSFIRFYNSAQLFSPTSILDALKRHHPSRPGNKILAKIFYMTGLFENWGSGTLKIIEAAKENQTLIFKMGCSR